MNDRTAIAIHMLIVVLASFSTAWFFGLGLGYDPELSAQLAFTVLFALWIVIPRFVANSCNEPFKQALFRDAISFLPFLLLNLWIFAPAIQFQPSLAWGNYDIAALASNLFKKLLLTLSIVGFVSLKLFMLPAAAHEKARNWLASHMPRVSAGKALAAMCVVYFLTMFSLSVLRYLTFKTPAPDLWIFNQAMWNTLHGNFMLTTRTLELGNQVVLGDHFFLILLLILPAYALFQSPLGLYFIESILVTSAAIPLYWIARDLLKSRAAGLAFSAAYLLYPALQFVHLAEFQPVAFTIPFLLFAFHFLLKKRTFLFALFAALALSVRETQAPIMFFFGIYIALAMKRYKLGIAVSAAAVAWLLLAVFVFIPAFGPPYQYVGGTQNAFPNLGSSPTEMVSNIVSNPLILLREATTMQDLGYLALLFLPVSFLSLLSPAILIPASVFAINLLSGRAPQATIYFQYNAELIAFLFIAAVLGARRLRSLLAARFPRQIPEAKAHNSIIATLLVSSIVASILFGPTPLSLLDPAPNAATFSPEAYAITPHHQLLLSAVASIPQEASVSTDSLIAAHLSGRRQLDYFPEALETSDYVLVDSTFPEHTSAAQPELVAELRSSRNFEVLLDSDGILLLKRREAK